MSQVLKTPVAILSFPCLFKPEPYEEGDKPAYSAALVFTPEAQATPEFMAMKQAALEVAVDRWGGKAKAVIQKMRFPLFRPEWEEKGYPEGSVYINVRATNRKPQVVSDIPDATTGKVTHITEEMAAELGGRFEVYPGARVQATVGAFTYDKKGNKGISFGLNNILVLYTDPDERERLAGGLPAEDEFEADAEAAVGLDDLTEEQTDPEAGLEGDEPPEEVPEPTPAPKVKPGKGKKKAKAKAKAKPDAPKAVDLDDLFKTP